jgi:Chaperone of endosialidase
MSIISSASNYTTVLVDTVTNQLRYIAPKHQFQTWGPNQNPNQAFGNIMAQTSACNVMTMSGSGLVGIGTTNPLGILHVTGNSSILPQSPANIQSNSIVYDANNTQGGIFISGNKSANLTGLFISQYSGNPYLYSSGYTVTSKDASLLNADGGRTLILASSTNNGLVVDGAGNVGVGAFALSNAFSVTGPAAFGTYAATSTATALASTCAVGIGGNLGIGTTNPTYPLHVQGNAFVSGTFITSNLSVLGSLDTINAYTIDTSNVVITNNGIGPALSVTQNTTLATNNIADFYGTSSGVPFLRIANSGNIGFGTTSPGQKLHIYGTGATTTPTAVYIDNQQETTAGGNPAQFLQFRNLATGTTPSDYFAIGASFNTNKNLYISASSTAQSGPLVTDAKVTIQQNGNVGIGTTVATTLLQVNGTVTATTFSGSASGLTSIPPNQLTTTANLPYGALQTVAGLPSGTSLGGSTVIPLITVNSQGIVTALSSIAANIQWTGTSPNPIYYTSNVGINTTVPSSYALDVTGQTRHQYGSSQVIILKSTSTVSSSNEIYFDSTSLNANCRASIGVGTDTGTGQRGAYWNVNGADRINIAPATGNIGIGSAAPIAKLDVAGTGNFQNTLSVNYATVSTDASVGHLYLNNSQNAAGNNASALIRVNNSTGSPFIGFDVLGVSGWSAGIVNTNVSTNAFAIRNTNNFTGGNILQLSTTGTLTATTFSGSGASLTNIPAAQLTGTNTLPATVLPLVAGLPSGTSQGGSTTVPVITVDNYGRTTALSTASITGLWNNAGNGYYYGGGSLGNVGIGTTFPTQLFNIFVNGIGSGTKNAGLAIDNIPESTAGGNPIQYIQFRNLGITNSPNDYFAIGASYNTNKNLYICASSSPQTIPLVSDAKITLQQAGNVGIGTTIPGYQLQIYGNSGAGSIINTTNTSSTSYAGFNIYNDTGNASIYRYSSANSMYQNQLNIINNSGPIYISSTGGTITNSCGSYVISPTSLANAFQVYANGVVSVGANPGTANNKIFTIYDPSSGDTPSSATNFYGLGYNASMLRYQVPGTTGYYNTWYGGSTAMMQLTAGNLTLVGDVTAFGTISDIRFKDNISSISSGNALNTVMQLNPVSFNWKQDIHNKEKAGTEDIGFIAQEVEGICPLLVDEFTLPGDNGEDAEKYKKVKYEKVVPYLVKVVQDLVKENREIRQELEKLKGII